MNLAYVMQGGRFIVSVNLRTYGLRLYMFASEHDRCVITSAAEPSGVCLVIFY